MSEATIEYKNSPNESTAYAVSEGQKTKVQLVATPAGDLELSDSPNVDTGYLVINGEKHKCALVAEVAGELKLPTSATDDSGYVTAQDGRQHKVKLVANVTSGGGGTQINNQDINVTQNGIYQAEEGYTGLGTVNVNVASGSPTQKFGATIDNFLGDVDADGNYTAPSEPFEVNLAGVKSVANASFVSLFYRKFNIQKFIANDLTYVGPNAFEKAFQTSGVKTVEFLSLESVTESNAFNYAFYGCASISDGDILFPKLKRVSGNSAFENAFAQNIQLSVDKIFPALEEISADKVFSGFFTFAANKVYSFSNVKKIYGSTTAYYSTFGGIFAQNTVWNFPSATEMTGYIWNGSTTITGEIHFAAANQAAIEACEGYDYKWGFAGATIYFDL